MVLRAADLWGGGLNVRTMIVSPVFHEWGRLSAGTFPSQSRTSRNTHTASPIDEPFRKYVCAVTWRFSRTPEKNFVNTLLARPHTSSCLARKPNPSPSFRQIVHAGFQSNPAEISIVFRGFAVYVHRIFDPRQSIMSCYRSGFRPTRLLNVVSCFVAMFPEQQHAIGTTTRSLSLIVPRITFYNNVLHSETSNVQIIIDFFYFPSVRIRIDKRLTATLDSSTVRSTVRSYFCD